ncbi:MULTISPECIES: DUF4255 domain-containing protein [unclassified Symbiopectobacterium]|uniref:DUF4255 domain-containing protein n=1 Tax=unclassified Symbiopectobacterium TaxID=2794573 RepID=UPI0022273F93|nr:MULTISPECIES: DUF4255 domain-containing protein [unclassified Symbiopectobacterium]MCW2473910.1 DUF4255 domain-containing protein [Candidatus Symbiopectobacterium sp. NZEC151]MCW2485152.1 DUF4255 domain-containing protein [Candidatus Symbiopectobacterium sp. NZEC127]
MLDLCLDYLKERMNQSVKNVFDLADDLVIVSPPTDLDGSKSPKIQNKILVFVSNIEKDAFSKSYRQDFNAMSNRTAVSSQPLFITMTVTVAANFSTNHYSDGLKVLSHFLAFFNRLSSFNRQNSPDLPKNIEQINMELESIPGDQLNHMWGIFGSHYLPSCNYRVRVLIPDSESILSQVGNIHLSATTMAKREN